MNKKWIFGFLEMEKCKEYFVIPIRPQLLPFSFLACCAILPAHLEAGIPFEAMTGCLYSLNRQFSNVFLSCKAKIRNSVHSPGIISLSPLSLANRRDWSDTRVKWSLAKAEGPNWWHLYNSLNLVLVAAKGSWIK